MIRAVVTFTAILLVSSMREAQADTDSCGPECDFCWYGHPNEDNCPPYFNGDGTCDCGGQYVDLDCPGTGGSSGDDYPGGSTEGGDGTGCSNPPAAHSPMPANGETGVEPDFWTHLDWAPVAPEYEVYFGTSSPPPFLQNNNTSESAYWLDLQPGRTYYWQVVAIDGACSTTGPVWSFQTARVPALPTRWNMQRSSVMAVDPTNSAVPDARTAGSPTVTATPRAITLHAGLTAAIVATRTPMTGLVMIA